MAKQYGKRFLVEVLTVPYNEPIRGYQLPYDMNQGFMPQQYAGKWVWNWALGIVYFVAKGNRTPVDNRPWHYSCLPTDANYYKEALLRALKCEAMRIKRLDLPTESI